jgi:transposase-like protein
VLIHKIREALLRQRDDEPLEGRIEADGGHFCGKPRSGRVRRRPKNEDIAAAVEARLKGQVPKPSKSRTSRANMIRRKNRRIAMVFRQHSGITGRGAVKTRVSVAMHENSEAADLLAARFIKPGSTVWTDESGAYTNYSQHFDHDVVEHSVEYSRFDGVNENQAESYFSRMRRAEYGIFHGFRKKYFHDYLQEFAWREDSRRLTTQQKLASLFENIRSNGRSIWWRGYWQGHQRDGEYMVVGS